MVSQGIIWGLSLSFLIGPLLFSIVDASLERGFRAGLSVAAGIWISDVLFAVGVHGGIKVLASIAASPDFKFWAGIAGGILLIGFGVTSLITRQTRRVPVLVLIKSPKSYFSYFLRGFLINTINPGTLFFWLSITGAVIIPNGWNSAETWWFFTGMLGTLVIADTLKAYGAKLLRRVLLPAHTRQLQRGIGLLLIIFGVSLVIRVF